MAKILQLDLDGVLTEDADTRYNDLSGTYTHRKPRRRAIELAAKAMEAGWTVIIYTGRREEQRRLTENWLYERNVRYHFLLMGKPYYTVQVDDRVAGASVDEQLKAVEKLLGRRNASG